MRIISTLTKIFLSLLICSSMAVAQDPNFHIYLALGQSNMEGQGAEEQQDRNVDARFQVMGALNCSGERSLTQGAWAPATPPLFRCNTGLSPADYFGRKLVENLPSDVKVGIVPVAVAGCQIAMFDKNNYMQYVNSEQQWLKNIANEYGGNPYGRLVDVAKAAQKDGVIMGIIFHQGESNSGQQDWPQKVKGVYDNLIKDLGLDPTKTPLLVGEVVTTQQGGQCGGHNSVIANVPNVIPNSHVISAEGLGHTGDRLHFTSASYRTLGERYADKMLTLLPKITNVYNGSELQGATAFPNPFTQELNLVKDGAFKYELMDAMGKIIESGNANDEVTIGQNINSGVYVVKISQNGGYKVLRVVKE